MKIQLKTNYGKTVIYPACPITEKLAEIAGTKTLTYEVMGKFSDILSLLGCEQAIEVESTEMTAFKGGRP